MIRYSNSNSIDMLLPYCERCRKKEAETKIYHFKLSFFFVFLIHNSKLC